MVLKNYIPRFIEPRLQRLTEHFPCVVISGARQVGKSTLIQHQFPQHDYVVFDPVVGTATIREDPELFLRNIKKPMILDEIQYVPEIVPVLKRWIDEDRRPGQYILTGSQQWGVLKMMAESLAGRAVFLDLAPLSLGEIALSTPSSGWLEKWLESPEDYLNSEASRLSLKNSLYEQLWRGFFPEAQRLPLDLVQDFQSAYQTTYIQRDIRLLAEVSDLSTFSQFVQLAAGLTAQEVNFSHLGRDLGISPNTAKHWLQILGETFQWFTIPAFSMNLTKRVSSKPKGFFADTGQVCFAQAISSPRALGVHPLWGNLFENAVVCEILKRCSLMTSPPKAYHWRSYGGAEVDLILERDGWYFPIEIKSNSRPTRKAISGLKSFRSTYPNLNIAKGLVLSPSETRYALSDDDWVFPWDLE